MPGVVQPAAITKQAMQKLSNVFDTHRSVPAEFLLSRPGLHFRQSTPDIGCSAECRGWRRIQARRGLDMLEDRLPSPPVRTAVRLVIVESPSGLRQESSVL